MELLNSQPYVFFHFSYPSIPSKMGGVNFLPSLLSPVCVS